MEMEGIEHRTVAVNGIAMHVAINGPPGGPTVLLLHGFPELWYSWRHQMAGLAALGYRAVAPDLRGFGDTDAPASASAYTNLSLVGDLVALLDTVAKEEEKVFVAGHDWGAVVAWHLSLFRPDRVKALVALSVPFAPRNPARKPLESLRTAYGEDYYICRFQIDSIRCSWEMLTRLQIILGSLSIFIVTDHLIADNPRVHESEPGEMEAEFAQIGTRRVIEEFFMYRNPGPLFLPKGKVFGHPMGDPIVLPPWLTEEDVDYYASKYEKTGFTGGFNYYRALDLNWELKAPWNGAQIRVPTKFMVGDLDLTYNSSGTKDFILKGGLKKYVPFLEDVVVMEGVAHFIHEERPQEVTQHIHDLFQMF